MKQKIRIKYILLFNLYIYVVFNLFKITISLNLFQKLLTQLSQKGKYELIKHTGGRYDNFCVRAKH